MNKITNHRILSMLLAVIVLLTNANCSSERDVKIRSLSAELSILKSIDSQDEVSPGTSRKLRIKQLESDIAFLEKTELTVSK